LRKVADRPGAVDLRDLKAGGGPDGIPGDTSEPFWGVVKW
jgi:hypothetical protein